MTAHLSTLPAPPYSGPIELDQLAEEERPAVPQLESVALHGLAGRVVRALTPHTEAHPAGLLATFLASFGSAVGAGSAARADGAPHPARLYMTIVGASAKARKGTSWHRIRPIMDAADPEWTDQVISGLSSGEGLIKTADDRGADKRIMVFEPEFARVLSNAGREGNILSAILREAWDGSKLQVRTKEPLEARGASVSFVAHITTEELQAKLSAIEAANGFANRFLYVYVYRQQLLPHGGDLDLGEIADLARQVADALQRARPSELTVHRRPEAMKRWEAIYQELAADDPGGLVGALTARAEAQVLRLSVVYALLDGTTWITAEHQEAALGFWRYCRASTELIFGNRLGDPDAERVVQALKRAPDGVMSRTELGRAVGRGLPGRRLDAAIAKLEDRALANVIRQDTTGRPRTLVALAEP